MSSEVSPPVTYQFTKPARTGKPIVMQSMKPPQLRDAEVSEKPTPYIVGVAQGREIHVPVRTTSGKELYTRVNGRRRDKAAHTGLDNRIFHHFVVWRDAELFAEAIDTINTRLQGYTFGDVVDNRRDADTVHAVIDQGTGEVDIIYAPQHAVRVKDLENLVIALGPLAGLNRGTAVGAFEVERIDSNTIYFTPVSQTQEVPAGFA